MDEATLKVSYPRDSMRDIERRQMEDAVRPVLRRNGWLLIGEGADLENGQRELTFERRGHSRA